MVAAAQDNAQAPTEAKPILPKRAGSIPIGIKLRAQNLYLNKSYTPKQVADATGLTTEQVYSLAARGGWAKIRNSRIAAIAQRVETRTGATISAVEEAICSEADELALRSLDRTGQALSSDHKEAAKDAQAFSATLRNLVTVSRAIRAGSAEVGQQGNTQVNLFFFRPSQSPMEKPVTEEHSSAVDVAATVVPAVLPPATT